MFKITLKKTQKVGVIGSYVRGIHWSPVNSPQSGTVKQRVPLTHWGRVTHISVSKLTIIDSDNGLSPGQCQAIIWTNAGILLIRPSGLGTNFSEILIEIHTFSFKKIRFNVSSVKWRPFCISLNVLRDFILLIMTSWHVDGFSITGPTVWRSCPSRQLFHTVWPVMQSTDDILAVSLN